MLINKHNRPRPNFLALEKALIADGAVVVETTLARANTWRSYQNLMRSGLVEMRRSGPRGGMRYHATPEGGVMYLIAKGIIDAGAQHAA